MDNMLKAGHGISLVSGTLIPHAFAVLYCTPDIFVPSLRKQHMGCHYGADSVDGFEAICIISPEP